MKRLLAIGAILVLAFFSTSARAEDCIDVELGAEVIETDPYDILSLYFSVLNCGTEPGMATFTISLDKDGEEIGTAMVDFYLPAGETFVQELELPIPDIVPPGTYTLCVTAELGTASDTACAEIVLGEMNEVMSFQPLSPTGTEGASWGAIKSLHR